MFKGMKQWAKRGLKIRFEENNDMSEADLGDLSTAKFSGRLGLCNGCKPSSQTSRNTLAVVDADNFRFVKGPQNIANGNYGASKSATALH